MIRITVVYSDESELVPNWRTIVEQMSAVSTSSAGGAATTSASVVPVADYLGRPVSELCALADSLFIPKSTTTSSFSTTTADGGVDAAAVAAEAEDGASLEAAASLVTQDSSFSQQLQKNIWSTVLCSAQWQSSAFPMVPVDRNEHRPLVEVVPGRKTTASDVLHMIVARPSAAASDILPATLGGGGGSAATLPSEGKKPKAKQATRAKAPVKR